MTNATPLQLLMIFALCQHLPWLTPVIVLPGPSYGSPSLASGLAPPPPLSPQKK